MGRLPAEVRAMTPAETADLIAGWNDAHSDGQPKAPSLEEYEELVKRYG